MAEKKSKKSSKTKTTKSSKSKKTKKNSKTRKKSNDVPGIDSGIVVVDDDLNMDKEAENEARKAYLEEARSQESSD